jgi:competence protein ComEA
MSAAPTHGEEEEGRARSLLARLARVARASAWAPLAGKAVLGIGGVMALALIGSGAMADLLPAALGSYLGPPPAAAQVPPAPPSALMDAGAPPARASQAPAPEDVAGPPSDAGTPSDAGAAVTQDGKVILNLAAEDDLRKLPGIGATRARAILALRQKLGRFKRPEDLLRVKGIGRRSLAKLRPKILIDAPP